MGQIKSHLGNLFYLNAVLEYDPKMSLGWQPSLCLESSQDGVSSVSTLQSSSCLKTSKIEYLAEGFISSHLLMSIKEEN